MSNGRLFYASHASTVSCQVQGLQGRHHMALQIVLDGRSVSWQGSPRLLMRVMGIQGGGGIGSWLGHLLLLGGHSGHWYSRWLLLVHVNARIEKLNARAVAIDIDHRPQQASRIDAVLLVQSLGPEARPVGQIRTGVLGQRSLQRYRIVAGESKANSTVPVVRDLSKLHADPLVDANRTR
nr:AT27571p [Drosophila melanogaster]